MPNVDDATSARPVRRFHRRAASPLDPEALLVLYREDQFIHLLPSLDFEAQEEFLCGTQAADVIDYFAEKFHGPA